jgi:hypothetical protein
MLLLLGVLVIFGGTGAWVGWYRGTKAIYRRSDDPMDAPFASRSAPSPRLLRLKRQRALQMLFFAVGGVTTGAAILTYLARR